MKAHLCAISKSRKMEDGVILLYECNVFIFESSTVDVIINRDETLREKMVYFHCLY
jgi:hypothetical protein